MTDTLNPDLLFYGSIPDALLLDDKWTTQNLLVNGQKIEGVRVGVEHGQDSPVATCEIEIATEDLALMPLGASVQMQAGYGSAVGTIFDGNFYEDYVLSGDAGGWTRLLALGHAHRLTYPSRRDIVFAAGKTRPLAIFKALCSMRGIPNYFGEEVYDVSMNLVELGGLTAIDDGTVLIPKDTNLLDWMNEKFGLFEYWVGDQPDGSFQLMRILTPPEPGTEEYVYEEGQAGHVNMLERSRRSTDIINDWRIEGASWTDDETEEEFAIVSFPVSAPVEPLLPPLFYQHAEISDEILVTQELADAVRNAKEVRYGALTPGWSIDVEGDPTVRIGDPIRVVKPSSGDDDLIWVTNLRQDVDEAGYWMTIEGWAGLGTSLPRGNDCATFPLLTGTVHLGNEYLSNYRVPSPNGNAGALLHKISFTVPESYTSLKIFGWWHGCNNLLAGEITASKFEIWQGAPLEKVADGELPRQKESLTVKYGTGFDANWTYGPPIMLKGSLESGPAEFRIVSGQNDDFEVRDLNLVACGVGSPVYPTEE